MNLKDHLVHWHYVSIIRSLVVADNGLNAIDLMMMLKAYSDGGPLENYPDKTSVMIPSPNFVPKPLLVPKPEKQNILQDI